MTLLEATKLTEEEAREYMETLRWPNDSVCPHCGSNNHTRLNGKSARPGTIQCNSCREQYTVTVGTVMESSHIPLAKWVMGFHLICSSKKGISAAQLQRELGLGSYRTAWFMAHRIRHAMKVEEEQRDKLKGTVEVDETYVGGKPRHKGQSKRGRGTKKTPVVALIERDDKAHSKPLARVVGKALKEEIHNAVDKGSTIMTDENADYKGIGEGFEGGHYTVKHSAGEYMRDGVHINTGKSYFALIKRGHYGVYHQMSR